MAERNGDEWIARIVRSLKETGRGFAAAKRPGKRGGSTPKAVRSKRRTKRAA